MSVRIPNLQNHSNERGRGVLLLITSLGVFYIVAILMPKRISWLVIWVTALFSLAAEGMSDIILDLHLNLFGYFYPGFQWSGFLAMFIYPPVNVIFLNYYPHSKSRFHKLVYIAGWTVFCLIFEVAALKSGYFYYTTWKLWHSALCYPVLLIAVLWQSRLTRRLQRSSDASVQ